MSKSKLEETLILLVQDEGLPMPERNWRFHSTRKWQLDLAWVSEKFAIEVEGGTWGRPVYCHVCGARVMSFTGGGRPYPVTSGGGRHVRGKGYERDCRKYNEANLAGWRLVRVTKGMIENGEALEFIKRGLGERR